MLYRIVLGDWSQDGHNQYDTRVVSIDSDHSLADLVANYKKNCERWGTTLDDIAHDYENNTVARALFDRMKADGAAWLPDSTFEDDEDVYLDQDTALVFAMDFIGCGMEPELQWHEVREEAPILIGTWSAPVTTSFGYGLFYT